MIKGFLLVNKPKDITSQKAISYLKKTVNNKIGHAGTLDPSATGLLLVLIGREYTKKASKFVKLNKRYHTLIKLGEATNTYDADKAEITAKSDYIPTAEEIAFHIANTFTGTIQLKVPLFSAKKVNGCRLYKYGHQKKSFNEDDLPLQEVIVSVKMISYKYPYVELVINCSSGTYIRSIAHELGKEIGSFAHVFSLHRLSIGSYSVDDAINIAPYIDREELVPIEEIKNHIVLDD